VTPSPIPGKISNVAAKSKTSPAEQVVERHGALVVDLCETVLWDQSHAQQAYHWISKQLRKSKEAFEVHERSWVLQIACSRIQEIDARHKIQLTPSEQIELDSASNPVSRRERFRYYFHRLTTEQRILLTLRERHKVPYSEIGAALGIPIDSLKILRQQALRTIEDWIWEGK